MTVFAPLAPAFCDVPDPNGVVNAVCLPEDIGHAPLADVVSEGPGHLLGGSLDSAFAHAAQAPSAPSGSLEALGHVPSGWAGLTPGGAVALVTITVGLLIVLGLIGYRVHAARSAR